MGMLEDVVGAGVEFIIGMPMKENHLTFLVALLLSLLGSYIFKYFINRPTVHRDVQLSMTCVYGLWLFYFCWGWNIVFPVFDVVLSYVLLRTLSPKIAHLYVFASALFLLSVCHAKNVLSKYSTSSVTTYAADFTGPVMIFTQKISSLAFGVHDGITKTENEMTEGQKKYVLRKMPSFLEYFAYMFNCFGILSAPFMFYDDFIKVIDAGCYEGRMKPPSSNRAVGIKIVAGLAIVALFIVGEEVFNCELIADEDFIAQTSSWYRGLYIYATLLVARAKYYGVWILCDAIYNAAGLGYNGTDEHGAAKWDGLSNINIPNIELATGMKTYIDNWNIRTTVWIRYVAYERLPQKWKTAGSFALSAFWHGFLPGYYLMFFTCHIFLTVQRKFRRAARPFFQRSRPSRAFYEVATLFATQLAIMYGVVPFVLLEWTTSLRFYRSYWYIGHIIGIALVFAIPTVSSRSKTSQDAPSKANGHANANGDAADKPLATSFAKTSDRNGQNHVRHR